MIPFSCATLLFMWEQTKLELHWYCEYEQFLMEALINVALKCAVTSEDMHES